MSEPRDRLAALTMCRHFAALDGGPRSPTLWPLPDTRPVRRLPEPWRSSWLWR